MNLYPSDDPAPSPKPSAEGTERGICDTDRPGHGGLHERTDEFSPCENFRPAPSEETLGTCDTAYHAPSLPVGPGHFKALSCVNWKPVAPEAVGTKELGTCTTPAYSRHPKDGETDYQHEKTEYCQNWKSLGEAGRHHKWKTIRHKSEAVGRETREQPTNLSAEPPYPNHRTVLLSMRDPNMTAHESTEKCRIEEPHSISKCGEFVPGLTAARNFLQRWNIRDLDVKGLSLKENSVYVSEVMAQFAESELSTLRRERDQLIAEVHEARHDELVALRERDQAKSQVRELTAQVKAHRESDQDRDRLVRELDHALFGPTTARQARLCDLAKTVPGLVVELRATIERLEGESTGQNQGELKK